LANISLESCTTLIASLHAIEYALNHFQRIIGLRNGGILFDAPAEHVSPEMIQTLYRITPVE